MKSNVDELCAWLIGDRESTDYQSVLREASDGVAEDLHVFWFG